MDRNTKTDTGLKRNFCAALLSRLNITNCSNKVEIRATKLSSTESKNNLLSKVKILGGEKKEEFIKERKNNTFLKIGIKLA